MSAGLTCLLWSLAPARAHGLLALRPGQPDLLQELAAADFNADGTLDLLAANYHAGDLSLYQESASGGYQERDPSPFIVLEGPTFIATTTAEKDLNGDGRPDAVIVDRLARAVSIRLSDPDLVLRATPNLILNRAPQAVAVADFTGDSRLDLAITTDTDDAIYLFSGKGDGTFTFLRTVDGRTSAQRNSSTAVTLYGIASADFNRDGRMDLAVTQWKTDLLALFLGNGNGTFQAPATFEIGRHPGYLQVARLNGDDSPDLAILLQGGRQNPRSSTETPLPGGAALLLGNGDGTFTLRPPITEGLSESPVQIAVGRIGLGSAGIDDLALVNFRSSTPDLENGTVILYPSDGSGGFGAPVTLGGPASSLRNPRGIALMDRDGNGTVDRIAVSNVGGHSITLFDGGGSTTFTEHPYSPLTATKNPKALATGNLDQGIGDDLVILSSGDPTLQTFSNMYNGFFFKWKPAPLPAGSDPGALLLGDFNRDLLADALVALGDPDGTPGPGTSPGFSILKGNGDNTFGTASGLCAGGSSPGAICDSDADCPGSTCGPPALKVAATSLFSADLNPLDNDLDGILDAADNCPSLSNPDQANTRGLFCLGGTTPGASCNSNPDCPGGGTCTGQDTRGDDCDSTTDDSDLDGIKNYDDNCPEVYNPDQQDFDQNRSGDACDHAPDLVVLEGGSNQAEFFFGRLDTGFVPPIPFPLGTDPAAIVLGNFTAGDTQPDLAVTHRGDGEFQIFKGSGNGAFVPQTPAVPAGLSPGALAVLDANPDDLDVDGVINIQDNCPTRPNPGQADADGDGLGDACSQAEDPDGDGMPTRVEVRVDNCPDTYNRDQDDSDGDRVGDPCDLNPSVYNPDDDNDLDGSPNATDNCPTRYNPDQIDSSGNGVGDACDEELDPDLDGFDTASKIRDNCPDTYNFDQTDFPANGIGDACEGVQDLALVDEAGGSVNLFIQSPPGSWIPTPPIPVGSQPKGLAVLDLNGDGVTDLVASSAGDSTVSILLGQGDGTFFTDPSFSTVPLPGPITSLRGGFFRADTIGDLPEVVGLSQVLENPVILVNVLSDRADADNSNRVDGKDLAIWARGFGLSRGNKGYDSLLGGDVNLDGKIDGVDLAYIAFQFGNTIPLP